MENNSTQSPPSQPINPPPGPSAPQDNLDIGPKTSYPPPRFMSKRVAIILLLFLIILLPLSFLVLSKLPSKNTASSPSPTPVSIADWKTYTNSKNGFVIKHPADAKVTEEEAYSFITTQSPTVSKIAGKTVDDNYEVNIYVEDNPNGLSPNELIDAYLKRLDQPGNNSASESAGENKMTDTTVNKINSSLAGYSNGQINGVRALFGADYDYDVIVMTRGNKVYTFLYSGDQGQKISDNTEKIISRILSTFQLTGQNSLINTGTKTYTNVKYGYTLNYPATWESSLDDENPDSASFLSPDYKVEEQVIASGVTISVSVSEAEATPSSIQEFEAEYKKQPHGGTAPTNEEFIKVGGLDAYRADIDFEGSETFVLVLKENKFYRISIGGPDRKTINKYISLFDQMLSSFKFL